MWNMVLVLIIIFLYFPVNAFMEKVQLDKYEHVALNILGKGAVLALTVFLCTFVLMLIRDKRDTIITDLEDKGVAEFVATAPRIKNVKNFNGKRAVTVTKYYVKYTAKLDSSTFTYYDEVSGSEEMNDLLNQKAVLNLRVFKGTDGKIFYGKESDTVDTYLAENIAWKPAYQKITAIAAIVFVLLELLLVPLGMKIGK